jgi:hypothetical protein
MRHPRIIIAGIGLTAVATPGLAPITTASARAATAPANPSGSGYGY